MEVLSILIYENLHSLTVQVIAAFLELIFYLFELPIIFDALEVQIFHFLSQSS